MCLEMLLAPEWHPVGPVPRSRSEPKWALSPNFSANLCYNERCHNWPTGCRHQTVARGKMAQYSSWWCPTRSFASIINASEISAQRLCWTYRSRTHPFIFSRLRMNFVYVACNPVNLQDSHYATPLYPSQFYQDRPSVYELGKGSILRYASATTRAGRPTRDTPSAHTIRWTLLALTLRLPATGSDTQAQTLAFFAIPNPQTPAFVCTSALVYSLFR